MSSPPSGSRTLGIHPIEAESYRIVGSRLDLGSLPPLTAAVTARVAHATADLELATGLVADEASLAAGVAALGAGATVVTDVEMLRAGISGLDARCWISEATAGPGLTRSAAAMRMAAAVVPDGAVWVVGCAPTALVELIEQAAAGRLRPALVVGMPVGFVGAADSKQRLRASGLPALSNVGDKGGSAAAAAAINALARIARTGTPPLVGTPTGTPSPERSRT
jgi:precorrin isomerase